MKEVRPVERDYRKELEGFERVWKRVTGERGKTADKIKLMPGKAKGRGGQNRRGGRY